MNHCPCCAYPMLQHLRDRQVHWFCRHCWAEMPNIEANTSDLLDAADDLLIATSLFA
jgi:hypothetical protein